MRHFFVFNKTAWFICVNPRLNSCDRKHFDPDGEITGFGGPCPESFTLAY